MRCGKCVWGFITDNGYYCECYDDYDMDYKDKCPWFKESE